MLKQNMLSMLAIIVSIVALTTNLVSSHGFENDDSSINSSPGLSSAVVKRLDETEESIKTLEMKLSAAVIELHSRRGVTPKTNPPVDDPRFEVLARQIQDLGKALKPLDDSMRFAQAKKLEFESVVADKNVSLRARLDRLKALRALPFNIGTPSEDTLRSLVELWQGAENGRLRRNVIRAMMGIKDSVLLEPLLQSLTTDEDEDVREEAVDFLAFFLDDPRARRALEKARDDDPHPTVRRHAKVALGL